MSDETMLFAKIEETDEMEARAAVLAAQSEMEKYLIFISDGIFYGLNTDYAKEIIRGVSITWLPMLPPHIRGVINLRGMVVPIVDFRLLLNRMPQEENDCIIIVEQQDTQIGILVDTVDQMVDVEKEDIQVVPYQSDQRMVSGMYSLPSGAGTVMIVDCDLLIHGE